MPADEYLIIGGLAALAIIVVVGLGLWRARRSDNDEVREQVELGETQHELGRRLPPPTTGGHSVTLPMGPGAEAREAIEGLREDLDQPEATENPGPAA